MNHSVNVSMDPCFEAMLYNIELSRTRVLLSEIFIRFSDEEITLTLRGDTNVLRSVSKELPKDMLVRPNTVNVHLKDVIMLWGVFQAIANATSAEIPPLQIADAMEGLSYRVSAIYPTIQTDRCEAVLHVSMGGSAGERMRKLLVELFPYTVIE